MGNFIANWQLENIFFLEFLSDEHLSLSSTFFKIFVRETFCRCHINMYLCNFIWPSNSFIISKKKLEPAPVSFVENNIGRGGGGNKSTSASVDPGSVHMIYVNKIRLFN